jgi:hypothetical protein
MAEQGAALHTVTVPVTVAGLGPYVPDPPTTLLLDVSQVEEAARVAAEAGEILDAAQLEADRIVETARADADRIVSEAAEHAASLKAASEADGDAMRAAHAEESARLRTETEQALEALRTAAEDERVRAASELEAARIQVDAIVREGQAAASALVADAKRKAKEILQAARDEAARQADRIEASSRNGAGRAAAEAAARMTDLQAVREADRSALAASEAQPAASRPDRDGTAARHLRNGPVSTDLLEPADHPHSADPEEFFDNDLEVEASGETSEVGEADDVTSEGLVSGRPEGTPTSPRPNTILIEPLQPAVFRATATDRGRRKRKKK